MKGQVRIEEMFAFIVVDPTDNTEGIPSTRIGNMEFPLVGADMKRIESLMPLAKRAAQELGVPVKLVKFQNRIELQEIEP